MTQKIQDNHEFRQDREANRYFLQEKLIFEVTERVCELLETAKAERQDLASRLGVSKSAVSQWLAGDKNMTLRTVSDLFWALGHEAGISSCLDGVGSTPVTRTATSVTTFGMERPRLFLPPTFYSEPAPSAPAHCPSADLFAA